jgi:hypothetical protein
VKVPNGFPGNVTRERSDNERVTGQKSVPRRFPGNVFYRSRGMFLEPLENVFLRAGIIRYEVV